MVCEICKKEDPCWAWTDTHGVAQCTNCGTPYRLYHYDDGKPIDKPPSLCISPEHVVTLQTYWNTTKRTIPGCSSFPGGQELASSEDIKAFNKWFKDYKKNEQPPA